VVVAAYVLGELAGQAERTRAVQELWARTGSLLVLVEPGTPSGYGTILDARTQAQLSPSIVHPYGVATKQVDLLLACACSVRQSSPLPSVIPLARPL
jgi:ribosomal protein RSM22 (predicted rRNA methylase)